ncbi:uncharacterized protein LOC129724577 [Wyeomyia smithii]|uniref:uncharacterized protein LOC129724577 n=1 Tax=Wyeomyia smithii TaxID=174621 RepID=UPI002467BCC7|nr:uncharacterized protein LOC129724577 [Wyeomyia smithii]
MTRILFFLVVSLYASAFGDGRPNPAGCIASSCDNIEKINTLFCHEQPELFCQCVPVDEFVWTEMIRPCALSTVFSFPHQKCVYDFMRNPDECYPYEASGSGDEIFPLEEWVMGKEVEMEEEMDMSMLVEDDKMEFLFPK